MAKDIVNGFGFVVLEVSKDVRQVKTSALFDNPNRGYKANPKWGHFVKGIKPAKVWTDIGGPSTVTFEMHNYVVTKGNKLLSCNVSVDRTLTNSGDAVGGWKIFGFVRFTIEFEGKTFKKWAMVHGGWGDDKSVSYKWADAVQSAQCSNITRSVNHKTYLIAPKESGNPGANLVPRATDLVKQPVQKATFIAESKRKSLGMKRVKAGNRTFVKISDADRLIDIETGNMSKLMVPGFQSPVFNVRSTTTFREDKDDNKVFSLTAGRWMCEQGEGTYQNIEIFDIAFGAAHRASVSVASTPAKKDIQKKRFKNKNVFRRL